MNKNIKPAFWKKTSVSINGKQAERLMLVLRTNGCEYAKNSNGGCTMCGFKNSASNTVSVNEMKEQLNWAINNVLSENNQITQVDLLHLGLFL